MRTIVTLATLLLFSSEARALDSSWDAAGGLAPDAIPRPYTLLDTADPEDPSLAGGVLTIATSEDAEIMYFILSGDDIDPPDPWVIEFEMRHVSGSSSSPQREPAQVFLTTEPDVGSLFQIGADSIFLMSSASTIGDSATPDTDDDFHTYRIEVFSDGSIDVYYDDALSLQGSTYVDPGDHGAVQRIAFGAGSGGSFGTSEWRSFGHDGLAVLCGDGIVDPPETCDDGNTTPGDGCDALCTIESVCPIAPLILCHVAGKASLTVIEKKAGSEKLKATLKSFDTETTQAELDDPATGGGSRYDLCLYDDAGQLAGELSVDRDGELCGPKQKPCWKAKGDKGYSYKDPAAASAGVKKIAAVSGPAGKGKAQVQAGNKVKKGQTDMPTGITALLAGAPSATMQLRLSGGACFEALLGTVKKNDATQFKGKAP